MIFTVFNTTSVLVELANGPVFEQPSVSKSEAHRTSSLVLTPTLSIPIAEGPASFFMSINGSSNATYQQNAHGFFAISQRLNPDAAHTFRISLPHGEQSTTLQLRGLWLRNGGRLLHPRNNAMEAIQSAGNDGTASMGQNSHAIKRMLVDVMASSSLLSHSSHVLDWPSLLNDEFPNCTITTVPISSDSCIASRCRDRVAPQDTFFRAGPPGTALHSRLWPFTSTTSVPHALILCLGLADVEILLSTQRNSKHDLTTFIDRFSRRYATFIQTIRRTAYSPSSLAHIRSLSQTSLTSEAIDESHLYNSAPSNLPILLVLPPVPSPLLVSHSTQIKSILHHATSKVLNELKWHAGDTKTLLIDTAGWLEDSDFYAVAPPIDSDADADADANAVSAARNFTLTQSGHVKFAYFLSLHLCPYLLGRRGARNCPFERHGEYTGSLYVPEMEGIGNMLEQKRVEKIKEIFHIA